MMFARFLPLYVVIFFSLFCYSSMLTLFVPLFQDGGSPLFDPTITGGSRSILAGVFLSLYPLGQFIGSPIIGALSDRLGRRRVLIASLLVSLSSLSLIALAIRWRAVPLLGVACFVAGLGESNMTIALSAIAGMTADHERVQYFSYAWVMCSLGYILGSMYGGISGLAGYELPFALEAACFIPVILVTLACFRNPEAPSAPRPFSKELLTFFQIFRPTGARPLFMANFLFYLAFFGVLRVELIYMQGQLHLPPAKIAWFYSYASVVAMVANFVVTPRLSRVLPLRTVLLTSVAGASLSAAVFILPQGEPWLYLATGLVGLFVPMVLSTSSAYLSSRFGGAAQGAAMGNNQSLQVLSEAVSAAAGGLIFAWNSRAPFLVFALVGLVGMAWVRKPAQEGCLLRCPDLQGKL
jgi:DHA1 family tetracycline resistance protein-like MFS transporter